MLCADHYVRSLNPDSNLHLMRAGDGDMYVVKLACGSRRERLLATECLALRLAADFGLPVAAADAIRLPQEFVARTPALAETKPRGAEHLAIKHIGGGLRGQVIDLFPSAWDRPHTAPASTTAAAVFAAWTECITPPRAIYWREPDHRYLPHVFIGFGACFAGGSWAVAALPARLQCSAAPDADTFGPEAFWWEAALTRISASSIRRYISELPGPWLADIPSEEILRLPGRLMSRAEALHNLVSAQAFAI